MAILLTFSMLYDYFWSRSLYRVSLSLKVLTGFLVGFMGVILILTPWTYMDGLFFDTRSVLLSTAGLFLGATPTGIAIAIVSVYRFIVGGPGALMGVSVAITSGLIGLLWARYREVDFKRHPIRELLLMGVVVHFAMILCTFLLPVGIRIDVQKKIILIVLLLYPIANMLLGLLMIRQRKNAENKHLLDVSEERWRFALEGSGDGVWDWDPQTNEMYYSDKWGKMLGYNINEIGSNLEDWNRLVHPDDYERVCDELHKLLRGEIEVYETEHRLLCKDGTYKWVLDRGKVMERSVDGKPLRCIGTQKDIHLNKLSEERLIHYQDQLKQFAGHLQEARESERLLLAREIHDELGQMLVAVKIEMGMLKQKMLKMPFSEQNTELIVNFEELMDLVNSTIQTTRKIMTDLRPEALNMLGFIDAANLLIKTFEERHLVECQFEYDEILPELDMQLSLALYRIVQEALNNVAKHSGASKTIIEFRFSNQELVLEIRDNGIGIQDSDRNRVDSYGLIGMSERVSLLGGEITITGEKGVGTIIRTVFKYLDGLSENVKHKNES